MKKFLKLTIGKGILFLILFVFFTFLPTGFLKDSLTPFPEINNLGLPLPFIKSSSCGYPDIYGKDVQVNCPNQFSIFYLILDLVITYLLSCLVIYLYIKLRKSLNTK